MAVLIAKVFLLSSESKFEDASVTNSIAKDGEELIINELKNR